MTSLGATVVDGGTRFEVWAPGAERVEVVLDGRRVDLEAVIDDRDPGAPTWIGTVDDVGHGDRYAIALDGGEPLPDPASRAQPDGVHGRSAVVDTASFEWGDDGWVGVELTDAVIYELHVGTFTQSGTFDGAIGQLPRLVDLGVTVVELMPVNAFPGTRNWGYDGVFPYATQASYGGPMGLARFVDAAHRVGLAVILDVVYNHVGPEGNVLARFGPFFTDAYSTPWGDAINVADRGSDGVRRFILDNVRSWIHDFHLDGLRVDAVHAIVDPTARPVGAEIVEAAHRAGERAGRSVLVTLESASNDPRLVRSTADHGWGADAVWNDDVHHALRVALTGQRHEYYAAYGGVGDLATALERRWVYSGRYSATLDRRHGADATDVDPARFIAFSTNHDHVGNTPRGDRLLADADVTEPRRRLAAAFILLSPFTPLLFMGEEYGERAPFPYFVDHGDPDLVEAVRRGRRLEFSGADWERGIADPADPATFDAAVLDPSVAGSGPHRGLLEMHTRLIHLRREHPVLTAADADQTVEVDGRAITVTRRWEATTTIATFNFGDEPVRARGAEDADVLFDSADPRWVGRDEAAYSPSSSVGSFGVRLLRLPDR